MRISNYAVLFAALLGFLYTCWLGDMEAALTLLFLVCVGIILNVHESQMKDKT